MVQVCIFYQKRIATHGFFGEPSLCLARRWQSYFFKLGAPPLEPCTRPAMRTQKEEYFGTFYPYLEPLCRYFAVADNSGGLCAERHQPYPDEQPDCDWSLYRPFGRLLHRWEANRAGLPALGGYHQQGWRSAGSSGQTGPGERHQHAGERD